MVSHLLVKRSTTPLSISWMKIYNPKRFLRFTRIFIQIYLFIGTHKIADIRYFVTLLFLFFLTLYVVNLFQEGEIGELCITGHGIASEYIGVHKDLSTTSFIRFNNTLRPEFDVIYRTGDYAKMVNGRIYYQGK